MNLKCNPKDFRVRAGAKVKLGRWPTKIKPLYKSKKHYAGLLAEYRAEISELQTMNANPRPWSSRPTSFRTAQSIP